MSNPINGHLPFAHRLQQCTLVSGCGPIDFVSQQNIREDWARTEFEVTGTGTVHTGTENVAWQQVGRKLHADKLAAQGFREGSSQRRFSQARSIFQQNVTTRQQSDDRQLDGLLFSQHRIFNIRNDTTHNVMTHKRLPKGMARVSRRRPKARL